MIRTKKSMRLCTTLLLLNLLFIWGNSLLPGSLSAAFSNWVKSFVPGQSSGGSNSLRKLAHFTEFTTLGMCLYWLFAMLNAKKARRFIQPFLSGAAVACIDETIQLFIPDRGPSIKDVGIDLLGTLLGIVFISLIYFFKNKQSNSLEET